MEQNLSLNSHSCILEQIRLGELPVIRKFGIIGNGDSWGKENGQDINDQISGIIEKHLNEGNFPFVQFKGIWDGIGDRFIILNIPDSELMNLCSISGQDYFISARADTNGYIKFCIMDVNGHVMTKNEINTESKALCIETYNKGASDVLCLNGPVLRTNLVDPNRISYSLKEAENLLGTENIISSILEINRRYEENGEDSYEYGGFANWGRRGRMLNLFRELQIKFAELN